MLEHEPTLETYARRRFALAGSAITAHYPYCVPIEDLGIDDGTSSRVSFAHYDYLGLAADPRLRTAAAEAIVQFGVGAGASRLVGGERALHRRFERELSDFLGVEDTLSLVSGYGANLSTVSHVLSRDDLLVIDEFVHNSIVTGSQLSRAQCVTFAHNDLDDLTALLKARRKEFKRVLVVVEGLYSMDGDIPDLPSLIEICRRHGAWLLIDEAHSIGVLGATGKGICEHFGIAPSEVDIIVGTLSKAFAGCGGFVAAKRPVIDWLRYTLPGFVYSVGMSPSAVATARTALEILQLEPERLRRLRANSRLFAELALERDLDIGTAAGAAVVPVAFSTIEQTIRAANVALEAGYFVPPIVQIAVPKNAPRLRFFITARHTRGEMTGVLDALAPIAKEKRPVWIDAAASIA